MVGLQMAIGADCKFIVVDPGERGNLSPRSPLLMSRSRVKFIPLLRLFTSFPSLRGIFVALSALANSFVSHNFYIKIWAVKSNCSTTTAHSVSTSQINNQLVCLPCSFISTSSYPKVTILTSVSIPFIIHACQSPSLRKYVRIPALHSEANKYMYILRIVSNSIIKRLIKGVGCTILLVLLLLSLSTYTISIMTIYYKEACCISFSLCTHQYAPVMNG